MSEGSVSATRCTGRGWRGRLREPRQWRLGRFRSGARPVLDMRTPELRHCAHDLEHEPSIGGNRLRGHDGPGAASPGVLGGARRLVGDGEWFGRFVVRPVRRRRAWSGRAGRPHRAAAAPRRCRAGPVEVARPAATTSGAVIFGCHPRKPGVFLMGNRKHVEAPFVTGTAAAAIFATTTVTDAGAASGA